MSIVLKTTVDFKGQRWYLTCYTRSELLFNFNFKLLGVQISSCGFARDGVTIVSFHRSVFISMRWKAVISRY